MTIWLILFFVTLLVSLFLAFRSMSDYYEQASNFPVQYSQFLIGQPDALTPEMLEKLHEDSFSNKYILSLERLFKGSKRALVIFGPITLLHPLAEELKLTEIEDYSAKINDDVIKAGKVTGWEVGLKKDSPRPLIIDFYRDFPELDDSEEFWWQVVLQSTGKKEEHQFEALIKAVLLTDSSVRVQPLKNELVKIGKDSGLAQLPQAHSLEEFLRLYRERALHKEHALEVDPQEIISLVGA